MKKRLALVAQYNRKPDRAGWLEYNTLRLQEYFFNEEYHQKVKDFSNFINREVKL